MIKLPKIVLIVILILLAGLQFFVITLIEFCFARNTHSLEFSSLEYKVSFSIISIIAFIIGIIFVAMQEAWTFENFADRIENEIFADKAIFFIQRKKAKMGWDKNDHKIKQFTGGKGK